MRQGEKLRVIRELYEAGSTIEAIAEATGYKPSSINQLLPKAGIFRKQNKNISLYKTKIISMRNEGKTLEEIAGETGFNACYISTYLGKIGYYKNTAWEEKAEQEIDESKLIYAEVKKPKREVVMWGGKRFVNVIDVVVGS